MEEKIREIMKELKLKFGATFDAPEGITPEMISILLLEMSNKFSEAFA